MPLGLPRTECRLTGRDWEWCVAPPLLHASKLSPDLEMFMPCLSLWSPWPLLQGEGHQVFVGYKDWPLCVLCDLGFMVDNSVPVHCPRQKSLLSDGTLASWAVVGTLRSQDLGLWKQKQTETMGYFGPSAQVTPKRC